MEEINTNVLKELIQTRKLLKQKYKELVSGEIDRSNQLEETFKPITKRMKELIQHSKNKVNFNDFDEFNYINKKVKNEKSTKNNKFTTSTPFKWTSNKSSLNDDGNTEFQSFYDAISTPKTSPLNTDDKANQNLEDNNNDDDDDHVYDDNVDDDKSDENLDDNNNDDDNDNVDDDDDEKVSLEINSNTSTSNQHLSQLIDEKELDLVYGPHKIKNNIWMFGDKSLTFHRDNNIQIGENNYELSAGLFQLLFNKNPTTFNQNDLTYYKNILMDTNAYRRGYKPNGYIKGNKSKKYTEIIKQLIKNDDINKGNSHKQSKHTFTSSTKNKSHNQSKHENVLTSSSSTKEGSGILDYTDKKPKYIYWDDPNELVDRLRLLIASKSAGHNNHNNEIVSIIEELKEHGYIK